jgi:hypothetical protein
VIAEIIAERYNEGLPSYVTSGLTLEGFTERYGDAVVRRITEVGGLPGAVLDTWPKANEQTRPLRAAK